MPGENKARLVRARAVNLTRCRWREAKDRGDELAAAQLRELEEQIAEIEIEGA